MPRWGREILHVPTCKIFVIHKNTKKLLEADFWFGGSRSDVLSVDKTARRGRGNFITAVMKLSVIHNQMLADFSVRKNTCDTQEHKNLP